MNTYQFSHSLLSPLALSLTSDVAARVVTSHTEGDNRVMGDYAI